MSPPEEPQGRAGWVAAIARHPLISAILAVCTVGGGVAGVWFLDADWSLLRRALAGAVGGAWVGLLISATKMVGR